MNTTYNAVYTFFKLMNLDVNEIPAIYKTVNTVLDHRKQDPVNLVIEYTAKTAQSLILQKDSRAFEIETSNKTLESYTNRPYYQGNVKDFEEEFLNKLATLSIPAKFVLWMQSFSSMNNEEIAHTLKMKEFEICSIEQEILSVFEPTVFDFFKQWASTHSMPQSLLDQIVVSKQPKSPTKKKPLLIAFLCIVLLAAGAYFLIDRPKETPQITIDPSLTYFADIEVKDYGTIKVQLDATQAPITVDNFVKLAKDGFYDGLTFHRIIDGFMIQGGDPLGNGMGGSDQTIPGEFSNNGHENNIKHVRGTISMARSQDPDSASSQFFIMHADAPHLDGEYAGFGTVISGMEVVDAIVKDAKPTDGNGSIEADQQPVIQSINVYTE